MKSINDSERGQVLVLLVLGLIGLLALTSLAIDGGNAYADRRNAQNAADNAAYSAALAWVKEQSYQPAGDTIINGNGYTSPSSEWSYTTTDVTCASGAKGIIISVALHTKVTTFFGSIIGWNEVNNRVSAQARGCKTIRAPLFAGNAVVGLKPSGDSFYTNGNASWILKGGGLFANSNAQGKANKTFQVDPGAAVVVVGDASSFPPGTPIQNNAQQFSYPSGVNDIMPPKPACNGTPTGGIVVDKLPNADTVFSEGVYCIMHGVEKSPTKANYQLNNATLYFMDPNFDLKFSGGGGFFGTSLTVGPYAGFAIVIAMPDNPSSTSCVGNFELRGNGASDLVGTIIAPNTCIDYRGNPGANTIGQVVGFEVTTLGTSDVTIDYNAPLTGKGSVPATVELLK